MFTDGLSSNPIHEDLLSVRGNDKKESEREQILGGKKDEVIDDQAAENKAKMEKVKNVVGQALFAGGRVALTFHIPYQIVSFAGGALLRGIHSLSKAPDNPEASHKMNQAAALATADAVKDVVKESGVLNVSLGSDLATFRTAYSPKISEKKMNEHITKGEELLSQLKNTGNNGGQISDELATPENVVHLMWALTKRTADKGELYISGAMRLQTAPLSPEAFENFLKKCGEKDKSSYPRISTHMKENILKGESQWGIDLKGMDLPANKQTLLFAKQPDGTIYLKMEYHGCPPFWKKGYRGMLNLMEFFKHSTDFVVTRFNKSGRIANGVKFPKRKEHVPSPVKKEYLAVADTLFPPQKMSFFERIFAKPLEEKEEFKKVASRGITAMKTEMEKHKDKSDEAKALHAKLEAAEQNVIGSSAGEYVGHVKGNEVVLTL